MALFSVNMGEQRSDSLTRLFAVLRFKGWRVTFPPFCKLMPLICLTRTKLGFKIPNDKEIKTWNGFSRHLDCKTWCRVLNFQLEFLIGYWLKWIKCCKLLFSEWQKLFLTSWDIVLWNKSYSSSKERTEFMTIHTDVPLWHVSSLFAFLSMLNLKLN